MSKDTDRKVSMLLDLQRLLLCQPFTDDMRPAKGERQKCDQLLEPLRMHKMSLFQPEAATLQAAKESFDLPAARVIFHRSRSRTRRDHDDVFARRQAQPSNKERQAPDRADLRDDQRVPDTLRAQQPPDLNGLSAPVLDF